MSVKIKVLEKEAGESGDFIDPVEVLGLFIRHGFPTVLRRRGSKHLLGKLWSR